MQVTELKSNMFYSCYEECVYICFEKPYSMSESEIKYKLFKDDVLIAEGYGKSLEYPEDPFTRPQEFDNDHHTELYKPDTRNWLCYRDTGVNRNSMYCYKVVTDDGLYYAKGVVNTV